MESIDPAKDRDTWCVALSCGHIFPCLSMSLIIRDTNNTCLGLLVIRNSYYYGNLLNVEFL
jgi:hypothetical protein